MAASGDGAPPDRTVELALIGAGPTAASLLERVAASAGEILGGRSLRVHLVDPERAGTGRVWRPDISPLLWMNSMAEDVTMFPDHTVRCEGPLRPGPTLLEWARQMTSDDLADLGAADLAAEIAAIDGMTFPTRRVQSAYLEWFHRHVLASLPDGVEVVAHPFEAADVVDVPGGRQLVMLAGDGGSFLADVVVLTLGHLDAEPDDQGVAFERFARRHGAVYVGPGHTADLDLSALEPGQDVIVTGFGQAFTDLVALVTEGRGGRFVPAPDGAGDSGWLRYEPSGREPVLHVGSRRGVPYRSKLSYRLQGPSAPLPRFLDDAAIGALLARPERLTFTADVLPLVLKEIGWAWYHELFAAHAERATLAWDAFAARYAQAAWGPEIEALVAEAVPDPADRFEIERLDRPLAGLWFDDRAAFEAHLRDHVAADVARRTDPAHSADLAAFTALLVTFGAIGRIAASGRMTDRSRVEDVAVGWFSFFMYYASGPPPARLRQLVALADAGIVRFVGADMVVAASGTTGRFTATSSSHPDEVEATALVDARIAPASVSRSRSRLLRTLAGRGEVSEDIVREETVPHGSWEANTGRLAVTGPALNVRRADGSPHPRRHALGQWTNRPAGGTFARPRTNALVFRQSDAVARAILTTLAGVDAEPYIVSGL